MYTHEKSLCCYGSFICEVARLLASKGMNEEVPYPDISTKAKAQKYIGLDVEKMEADKMFL